jgi:hypothetical protein
MKAPGSIGHGIDPHSGAGGQVDAEGSDDRDRPQRARPTRTKRAQSFGFSIMNDVSGGEAQCEDKQWIGKLGTWSLWPVDRPLGGPAGSHGLAIRAL